MVGKVISVTNVVNRTYALEAFARVRSVATITASKCVRDAVYKRQTRKFTVTVLTSYI